ncbi:MAG TPA: GNAT family N-acetyltransferase [Caulobacteraceae bacterium]|jgi:GNAT superfamily N-acetyltransferase|nr:GNAT family N-acetyltransferase [Caulobacteraceae bacterium]
MNAAVTARESGVAARPAAWADADALSATLARAFVDDPLIAFLLPDQSKGARLFKLLFKLGLPHDACDVTSGYEAVALWRPPGKWEIPFWQYITNGTEFLGVFGFQGARKVTWAMDVIEKRHPHEPHWYLQAIGTDPDKQGKGYGGVVMRRQLALADAAHMPAYLESSKTVNIPIYQSFGFEVTGEIAIPGGPTLYPMWRKAVA